MGKSHAAFEDRIVCDPQILVGKPTVKGTRISVERVLGYLSTTPSFDELFIDFPRLTLADVQACFAYAQSLVEREGRREVAAQLSTAQRRSE